MATMSEDSIATETISGVIHQSKLNGMEVLEGDPNSPKIEGKY